MPKLTPEETIKIFVKRGHFGAAAAFLLTQVHADHNGALTRHLVEAIYSAGIEQAKTLDRRQQT